MCYTPSSRMFYTKYHTEVERSQPKPRPKTKPTTVSQVPSRDGMCGMWQCKSWHQRKISDARINVENKE